VNSSLPHPARSNDVNVNANSAAIADTPRLFVILIERII